jgi:hypothetical protein
MKIAEHTTWIIIINASFVGSFAAFYHATNAGPLEWEGVVRDALVATVAGLPGLIASLLYLRLLKRSGAKHPGSSPA